MKITRVSPVSGKTHIMDINVTEKALLSWQNGQLIQEAMPNLTPAEREFILTGITEKEWNSLFFQED